MVVRDDDGCEHIYRRRQLILLVSKTRYRLPKKFLTQMYGLIKASTSEQFSTANSLKVCDEDDGRTTDTERERERERECVCVCVCVHMRMRQSGV